MSYEKKPMIDVIALCELPIDFATVGTDVGDCLTMATRPNSISSVPSLTSIPVLMDQSIPDK